MAYRKFKLQNSLGDYYYLTEQNYKHFFNNPTGLGVSKSISGTRVGNRYKIDKRTYSLPNPSGEIVFYDDTNEDIYDAYAEFVRFAQHYPLKLFYYTPGNNKTEEEANSIYLNCELESASKSQIQQDSTLRVAVTFKGTSFWLSGQESVLTIVKTDDDPGTFTFPLSFPFSFGTDPFRNITMPNKGTLVTPVIYEINGACSNPYIRFYDEATNEYAASKFIGDFDYVYVDSNDNNEIITLRKDSITIANPASKQDLTIADPDDEDFFMTFMKVKPGSTYATFSLGSDFQGSVTLRWRDEYLSL